MISENITDEIKKQMLPEYQQLILFEDMGRVFIEVKQNERYAKWSENYQEFLSVINEWGITEFCNELKFSFDAFFENPLTAKQIN